MSPLKRDCLVTTITRVPERPSTLMGVTPTGFPKKCQGPKFGDNLASQSMIAKMFPQRMDCLVMMNFRMPERPSILMTVTPTGFPQQRRGPKFEAPQLMIAKMFPIRRDSLVMMNLRVSERPDTDE